MLVVCNFSPVPHDSYRLGVPMKGFWQEVLNTDSVQYGGTGRGNFGGVPSVPIHLQGRPHSLTLNIPPLGVIFLKYEP
jgi:1,4-alpha-glucan branching enzyme